MEKLSLPPKADSLSESMRDIGYSLETAIADIIDNSITADASKVEICFDFDIEEPVLGIIDNGKGMNRDELTDAMRYGSVHPRSIRPDNDLGRFGIGLKTASLSQCRELTVISRKNGKWSGAVWDMDTLQEHNEWIVGILNAREISDIPYTDQINGDGTLVLWRKLDRLFDGELYNSYQDVLLEKIDVVVKHLALVFHRFLAYEIKQKKLDIFINGHQIEPFDPFCLKNTATQLLQKEIVRINGHTITIQPYILPHHSKLSPKEHDYYKEHSEFVSNQGAYIYRNNRLMAWGDWFRLVSKGEATKLARVRIDFPNALDEHWKIDIKKSKAVPPHQVKDKLRQIINRISEQSTRVHTGRGQRLFEGVAQPFWMRYAEHNGIRYSLNRQHPVLSAFKGSLDTGKQQLFSEVLEIIEKSIPVEAIYSDYSTKPKSFEKTEKIDDEKIRAKLHMLFDSISAENQIDENQFREIFSNLKPYCEYPQEIERIIKEKFYDGPEKI